jgi:hypothetical protein
MISRKGNGFRNRKGMELEERPVRAPQDLGRSKGWE